MKFSETRLKGAYVITPEPFVDDRGSFARVFCKNEFSAIGHKGDFVQINHSVNKLKGTFRGIHYQLPPFGEIKLIRCISGKVYDIIVDIRKGSPTFLKSFAVEISADNMKMMYVPEGFAHGFITLEDNSQLIYHHTTYYEPGHEAGLRYNDPALQLELPIGPSIMTEKDKNHPLIDNSFKGI
ncbi:MAG: dTDP-4-dehydrorhamnose 3,5-epimerase [Chlorobi bacterium]|nr:dTDP-4-dehydrorhamnose 3,5-epimerase [Chlorobiota bacterium]